MSWKDVRQNSSLVLLTHFADPTEQMFGNYMTMSHEVVLEYFESSCLHTDQIESCLFHRLTWESYKIT